MQNSSQLIATDKADAHFSLMYMLKHVYGISVFVCYSMTSKTGCWFYFLRCHLKAALHHILTQDIYDGECISIMYIQTIKKHMPYMRREYLACHIHSLSIVHSNLMRLTIASNVVMQISSLHAYGDAKPYCSYINKQ